MASTKAFGLTTAPAGPSAHLLILTTKYLVQFAGHNRLAARWPEVAPTDLACRVSELFGHTPEEHHTQSIFTMGVAQGKREAPQDPVLVARANRR